MQAIAAIMFFILGLFQLFAIMDGIQVWLGIGSFLSFMLALFLAYFPLVGTGLGMYGAVTAWGWSWMQAIGLFFGPFIVIVVITLLAGVFDRSRSV